MLFHSTSYIYHTVSWAHILMSAPDLAIYMHVNEVQAIWRQMWFFYMMHYEMRMWPAWFMMPNDVCMRRAPYDVICSLCHMMLYEICMRPAWSMIFNDARMRPWLFIYDVNDVLCGKRMNVYETLPYEVKWCFMTCYEVVRVREQTRPISGTNETFPV